MMLLELLIIGLINCLVIIGFHLAVQFQYYVINDKERIVEGTHDYAANACGIVKETRNMLWFIKFWCDRKFHPFWRKPLYDCPRCMASLHSIYVYFPLVTFENSLYIYPVYILFLSGLIEIITRRFEI